MQLIVFRQVNPAVDIATMMGECREHNVVIVHSCVDGKLRRSLSLEMQWAKYFEFRLRADLLVIDPG